ncbi:MAG: nucleoside-diphosphate kinase [Thermaerobacter sp.]|nr:nucleoside-diphosphate kinase [Thermaerobacter sp.]
MERTFFAIKPDGVGRGLVGEVIARLERKGLRLIGLKLMQVTPQLAQQHYAAHSEKPFFQGLVSFITSGPIVATVWEGREAVSVVRGLMGATDPVKSAPGTLRGDYGLSISSNLVHGSDGPEAAEREISLFFRPDELVGASRPEETWIYAGE